MAGNGEQAGCSGTERTKRGSCGEEAWLQEQQAERFLRGSHDCPSQRRGGGGSKSDTLKGLAMWGGGVHWKLEEGVQAGHH